MVKVANYMGHVEYDWDSPVWVHWLEELTRSHTLSYYDERGSGLSDWNAEDVWFEAWVRDLEAVVDAFHQSTEKSESVSTSIIRKKLNFWSRQ